MGTVMYLVTGGSVSTVMHHGGSATKQQSHCSHSRRSRAAVRNVKVFESSAVSLIEC